MLVGEVIVQGVWGWILLIPWPTLALLISAKAGGGTAGQVVAFLISAAANMAVYGLLGTMVSFCVRPVSRQIEFQEWLAVLMQAKDADI